MLTRKQLFYRKNIDFFKKTGKKLIKIKIISNFILFLLYINKYEF
tara:strand:- start:3958 stop:4092 length:135 start_codon:yes stop_codon:yes gene_type:complete